MISTRLNRIQKLKYSMMLSKTCKVYFIHNENKIITGDNISELIEQFYFWSILCLAEFLEPVDF